MRWIRLVSASLALCAPAHAAESPRHLLLITIDTLRADHLGCYGHPARATPALDRLAREGVRFANVQSPVPLTLPAHASLLTGLDPPAHGVRDNGSYKLAESFPTLTTRLAERGFATGAFVSAFVLDPRFGLARGFDTYRTVEALQTNANTTLADVQRPGGETIAEARAWIEQQSERRWFAWIHLYEPHSPYQPPEPFASRHPSDAYLGEVAAADQLVADLLDWLERRRLHEQTLVILTADHGEGRGDHQEEFHSFFIYESTLRVPLILAGPGIPGGRAVESLAGLIDIVPTALALLGLPAPDRLPGRDLSAAWRESDSNERTFYAETLVPQLHFGWSPLHALREGRFKYIRAPREELYDLEADPGELTNLAAQESERVERLRLRLQSLLEAPQAEGGAAVDAETLAKLQALGYTGALHPPKADPNADPKDRLEDFKRFNATLTEVLEQFRIGRPAQALPLLERLRVHHPELDVVEYYRGRALLESGQAAAAVEAFRRTLEINPHYVLATTDLAKALVALGQPRAALEALDRGFQDARDAFLYRLHRGFALLAAGDAQAAVQEYRRAHERKPDDPQPLRALAGIHLQSGRISEALDYLQRWVALVPGDPMAHNNLGLGLIQSDRGREAVEAFRAAVRLAPRDPRLRINLARALAQISSPAEAIVELRIVLESDPQNREAIDLLRQLESRE